MVNLKDEILQILETATNGKILTREMLEFTKGRSSCMYTSLQDK